MASSNVRTSSEALTNLQTDLSALSKGLHQTYNLMYDYMLKVGEFWQDRKYEEFVEDYQPKIEKCDEIATRYEDWCKKVLQPAIDRAHEAEDVNVGLDGGGPGAGGSGTGNPGAGGPGASGPGAGGPGTGGPGDSNINMASGNPQSGTTNHDPKMEALFYKTFPDIPSDSGIAEAYLKMSQDERGDFNSEYMRLQGIRDHAVFHAQDTMRMGSEMRWDGAKFAGAYYTAKGMNEAEDAEKQYKDGLRQLGERTLEGLPPKPTTKAIPIANGCGSDSFPGSFAFAAVGRALDTANAVRKKSIGEILSPSVWKKTWDEKGNYCNIHDICNYNQEGDTKCDQKFYEECPNMATGVMFSKRLGINHSYEAAGREHQESNQLQPIYEREYGKKLDDNYRVVRND